MNIFHKLFYIALYSIKYILTNKSVLIFQFGQFWNSFQILEYWLKWTILGSKYTKNGKSLETIASVRKVWNVHFSLISKYSKIHTKIQTSFVWPFLCMFPVPQNSRYIFQICMYFFAHFSSHAHFVYSFFNCRVHCNG